MGYCFNFLFQKTSTDDHCIDIGIGNRGRMGSKAHPEHRVLVRELGNSLLLGFKASFCIFLFISIRFFYWSVTPKEIFTRKKRFGLSFGQLFHIFGQLFDPIILVSLAENSTEVKKLEKKSKGVVSKNILC